MYILPNTMRNKYKKLQGKRKRGLNIHKKNRYPSVIFSACLAKSIHLQIYKAKPEKQNKANKINNNK